MIKKEFDSIELIEKEISWEKNSLKNIYTALKNDASIFIVYSHGEYQRLAFKKGQNFKIEEDYIIYDDLLVKEIPV